MNPWLLAAVMLLALLVLLVAWASSRGFRDLLTAVALGSALTTLTLVALTQAFDRPPFIDLALVLSFLAFAGSVAYARFVERGMG